ncbi:hypothetical protein K491DRAFT_603909 [Lophiostoma macrostomum CBS 122681]|uniref:Uncharacterized protein n=1 Tax=Lophiostoma macrostomum CBS 122681 TaxID=1314788 RepID=A0A6A6SYW9_9PLEO|nr:hypothetical protein K491DRAFT_603909 [Lophiostoma macrostomum CBS 122681]
MLDAPLTPAPAQPRRPSINPTASVHASKKDAAFSLLLSLPRELRDRIYTFALTSPYPFWWPQPTSTRHGLALGLLTTSRQVFEEAAPILYAGNKFLFTHPSDCNIFRVVASPKYSALITSVYFRIREKDLRLWTAYLGSTKEERSLKEDLPKLKTMWIFLRAGTIGAPVIGHFHPAGPLAGMQPGLVAQVAAVQHVLGQQVAALQQQTGIANGNANAALPPPLLTPVQPMPFMAFAQGGFVGQTQHNYQAHATHHHHHPPPAQLHVHGTQNNPPNPSPLAQHMAQQQQNQEPQPQPLQPQPHQHHVHGPFYAAFLRWERELGLENLCLSLRETKPVDADVKIVCILRLPRPEVTRLYRLYPDELSVDRNGDARTRFRKVHGVDVSLELNGFDAGG